MEERLHLVNPEHGGKVTCHKCIGFLYQDDDIVPYRDHQHLDEFPKAHFHAACFNPYEHYYGLDQPIDQADDGEHIVGVYPTGTRYGE